MKRSFAAKKPWMAWIVSSSRSVRGRFWTGQRLFDGMLWVSKKDYSVIRSEGQAVPQIHTLKSENLFPHFTTLRQKVEGDYWFPVMTYGDDTLVFPRRRAARPADHPVQRVPSIRRRLEDYLRQIRRNLRVKSFV